MSFLYFAYGSNMNEDELKDWKIVIIDRKKAILYNYRIALNRYSKNRQGGVLDIDPSQGNIVEGVLYELPDEAKYKLEKKEGVTIGAYKETRVDIEVDDRIIKNVIIYIVCSKQITSPASEEYKKSVLKGAKNHNLSEKYIRELKKVLEKRPDNKE